MPIEIKELLIRTKVDESGGGAAEQASTGSDADRQAIVAQCVDQVMQLLRDKDER